MEDKIIDLAISNKGFTLIEVAMVLIIVGILVGLGAGMLGILFRTKKDLDDSSPFFDERIPDPDNPSPPLATWRSVFKDFSIASQKL